MGVPHGPAGGLAWRDDMTPVAGATGKGIRPAVGGKRGGESCQGFATQAPVLVLSEFTGVSQSIIRSLDLRQAAAARLDSGLVCVVDGGSRRARPQLAIVIESDAAAAASAVRALKHRWRGVRVLVYGAADREDAALGCVAAGADGLVASDEPLEQLAQAARDVLSNRFHAPARLIRSLFAQLARLAPRRRQGGRPRLPDLSPREVEALVRIAQGKSNKEIAVELHIEEQTVKNHVHDTLRKLGVHSRAEAARAARCYVRDDYGRASSQG
jgi:DNA-binding NarL/FixJ family response regulator